MKVDPYFKTFTVTHRKWIKDLKVRAKLTNFLEENRNNFHDLGFSNEFLNAEQQKKKINKLDFKIKTFCFKGHYQESEKITYRVKENICKPWVW